MNVSQDDKEMAAKAIWMVAFEQSLKACKDMDLGSEATLVGMVTTMTSVLREVLDLRKEDQ